MLTVRGWTSCDQMSSAEGQMPHSCLPSVCAVTLKSAAITFHLNQSLVVFQFDELTLVGHARKQPSLQKLSRNHCAPQLSPRRSPLHARAWLCEATWPDAGDFSACSEPFDRSVLSMASSVGLGNCRLYVSARV